MPDRIVRDEILDSDRYLSLTSDTARMLYLHLLLVADDLGNTEATPLFIRRRLLPAAMEDYAINKILSELADVDLIRMYASEQKAYAHVPRFRQRLRYLKSKNPRPPAALECKEIKDLIKAKSDLSLSQVGPESVPSRQKRREEKRSKPLAPFGAGLPFGAGFDKFWAAYPRKKSRGHAEKTWAKLNPSEHLIAEILAAVETAKTSEDWQRDAGRFIPYPASWLNACGWQDEGVAPEARRLAV